MSAVPIVINLKESTDVVLISEPDKRIQRDATERVTSLLMRFVPPLSHGRENSGLKSEWERVHNAILVNGSRGSGKTTFIRNIFEDIGRSKDGVLAGLEVLEIIDPTLVEGKENIAITIIAQIVKKCNAHHENRSVPPKGDDKYREFKDCLKKLAGGFSLLEGVGSQNAYDASWDDPQHVMNHGLERARSGSEFEQSFHAFIGHALYFLGKSAFVLAFDDIDTKFEKGWPILEMIRKYLTTPQLILLISGDFGLYSQLVRREQYLNLGDSLLRHDRPHRNHHGEESLTPWAADPLVRMVDKLEEQYLQKVLKPENRITLSTLAEIEDARPRRHIIHVKASDNSQELPIAEFIDRILEKVIFVKDGSDRALYRRAILRQPLRTVIQFLKAGGQVVSEGDEVKAGTLGEFRASLPNIFASALYHKNLDPIAIASGDPDTLIAQMIAWSETTSSWETAYRLRPEYDDADQNMVAIVFASQFARVFNEAPGQALVYMIKLGLTREFMLQRREVKSREILQELGLDMLERPSSVARRAVGVQRSLSRRELGLVRGTVPVSGAKIDTQNMVRHLYAGKLTQGTPSTVSNFFKEKIPELNAASERYPWRPVLAWWNLARKGWKDQGPWRGYVYNTLNSLTEKFDRAAVTHLAACIMSDARSKDRSHVSIFPLIACLAEFMEIGVETDASKRLDQVKRTFVRLCQLRSYPAPSFNTAYGSATDSNNASRDNNKSDDDDDDDGGENESQENREKILSEQGFSEFLIYLNNWLEGSSTIRLEMPPSVYGKIITRLYYTLTRMDEELSAGAIYTGSMLHRQIIALLNSVLVEEMLTNNVRRKIASNKADSPDTAEPILDNPTKSDTPFWLNFPFREVGANDNYNGMAPVDFSELPLFKLVFSCPLWAFFLMPQTVVARGNKAEGWHILQQQLHCWTDTVPDEQEMERRRGVVTIAIGNDSFDNLWAPLNSVPVLRSGTMQNPVWVSKLIDPSDRLPPDQGADISTAGDADTPVTLSGKRIPARPNRGAFKRLTNTKSDEPTTAPDPTPDDDKSGDGQGN